jgi:nitrite reductase/ring-hydroxylating ferredoxin subunit
MRIAVAPAAALGEHETVKFAFDEDGARKEGFVIRHEGHLYAYRNECRHIPMTMDWVENRFLSRDGCYVQCATHGARYRIDTGLCVDGPPLGERLRPLPVEEIDGEVVVTLPEGSSPRCGD